MARAWPASRMSGRADSPLQGRWVALEPFRLEHMGFVHALLNHPHVAPQFHLRPGGLGADRLYQRLWERALCNFIVVERENEQPIGFCGGHRADVMSQTAYGRLAIATGLQGRGWPLESFLILTKHLFSEYRLRKLYFETVDIVTGLGRRSREHPYLSRELTIPDSAWCHGSLRNVSTWAMYETEQLSLASGVESHDRV